MRSVPREETTAAQVRPGSAESPQREPPAESLARESPGAFSADRPSNGSARNNDNTSHNLFRKTHMIRSPETNSCGASSCAAPSRSRDGLRSSGSVVV